jgi:pimeloyl-ACP methyl ester carboxylesterase
MTFLQINMGLLESRQLAIGEDIFSYIDLGKGAPVLFLHGALGDLRTWWPHCRALFSRYPCIAYTQRNFDPPVWRADAPPFSIRAHAADLIAVIEALGIGPVNLVCGRFRWREMFLRPLLRMSR